MGKKVMKLFLDTILRAAVIILAVAIVVMLVLLAKTMSKSKKADTNAKKEVSDIVTEENDPSDPTFGGGDAADTTDASADASSSDNTTEENSSSAKNAKLMVLNASGVSGVAATWQTTLTADGYTSVDIGTYQGDTQSSTTVYTSDEYDVSSLTSILGSASTSARSDIDDSMADVDISGSDIVVVIGVDNAANN